LLPLARKSLAFGQPHFSEFFRIIQFFYHYLAFGQKKGRIFLFLLIAIEYFSASIKRITELASVRCC
jgi:hypothetical protein